MLHTHTHTARCVIQSIATAAVRFGLECICGVKISRRKLVKCLHFAFFCLTYSHEMSEHLIMQQVTLTPLPYPTLHSATQCKPLCVMKPSRNSTCAVQVVEGGSAKRRQRSSKHQQRRRRSEERKKAKEWSLNTGEYTNHMIISSVVNTQIIHCCC